jgi:hypothetical protein
MAANRRLPRLGAEIEMPVMSETGASACVGPAYFERLADGYANSTPLRLADRLVGIAHSAGINSIDNGFNLLETAHAPIDPAENGLTLLEDRLRTDAAQVAAALAADGLFICTLAQHPTAGIDPASYAARVAPKSIYRYLTGHRGWNHAVGIDAKAQNGPTTEVPPDQAIATLNLLLTAAPAFIAIFANSPFEAARRSGLMETRMTLWPRMVAASRASADRARCGLPPRVFTGFADYWHWTFAPGTVLQALPVGADSYKGDGALCVAGDGRLGAAQFFQQAEVPAKDLNGKAVTLHPGAHHFDYLQWSNFLDFRLRFSFATPPPSRLEIAEAFTRPAQFEALFHNRIGNLYIENRCAGATFADMDLHAHAGADVAAGAMIGPSALQAGLTMAVGTPEAAALIKRWPMNRIRVLRAHAITAALGAPGKPDPAPEVSAALHALCAEVLDLALWNLPEGERATLRYPRFVLETGLTGAARALLAEPGFSTLDALAFSRRITP